MNNATDTTLDHHWMPFTANRDFKANPRLQVRAEGMYYWNDRGEKILDGCSGLFCVAAGHNRPEIREAVSRQLGELDYTPHFQLGFPGSFELARQLAELTPGDLNRLFFTCSGSEAVETSLKIALAYHRARGEAQRIRLVGRERAYHGVNFRRLVGRRHRTESRSLRPAASWSSAPASHLAAGKPLHQRPARARR